MHTDINIHAHVYTHTHSKDIEHTYYGLTLQALSLACTKVGRYVSVVLSENSEKS